MGTIRDGTGSGNEARVSADNKLATTALEVPLQMHHSTHGRAYQVLSGVQTVTGAYGLLAVRNDSSDRNLVITFMRIALDKTETAQALLEISLDGTWVAGTPVTPVSLNARVNNPSGVTAHYNALPTGSTLIDTRWVKGPDEVVYVKQGSIILPATGMVSIKVTPETASVKFNARISFVMATDEELA